MRTSSSEPAWSWLTAAIRGDARPPQQERQRQRALVRRAEDGGVRHARGAHPRRRGGRRPCWSTGHRARPRSTARGTRSTSATPGSRSAAARPRGPHSTCDRPAGGGRRPHGRPGQQDVAGVVEPGDEHGPGHGRVPGRAGEPARRPSGEHEVDRGAEVGRRRTERRPPPRRRVTAVGTSIDAGPGGAGGLDVGADVADDHAPLDGHAAGASAAARTMPGRRLAAGAAVVGPVRAPQHGVERPEQLGQTGVDGLDLRGGQQPPGHAALVRHDGERGTPAARRRSSPAATPGSGSTRAGSPL